MITKAYIEEIIDLYHYRVRIPIYHQIKSSSTATPKSLLPIATLCGLAGVFYNFKVGDIVYVAVEDEERSNIVILGSFLYEDSKTAPPDMTINHLSVEESLELGENSVSELPTGGGGGGGGSNIRSLNDIPDVNIEDPQNGDALLFNSSSQLWENGRPTSLFYINGTLNSAHTTITVDKTPAEVLAAISNHLLPVLTLNEGDFSAFAYFATSMAMGGGMRGFIFYSISEAWVAIASVYRENDTSTWFGHLMHTLTPIVVDASLSPSVGDTVVFDPSSGTGWTYKNSSPYIAQNSAPSDTSKFWVDTANNNVIKVYLNGAWVATSAAWT